LAEFFVERLRSEGSFLPYEVAWLARRARFPGLFKATTFSLTGRVVLSSARRDRASGWAAMCLEDVRSNIVTAGSCWTATTRIGVFAKSWRTMLECRSA